MKTRTIIALFLALTLTTLNVTRRPPSATNTSDSEQVFQGTNTPGIDEMLSDVVARCDGGRLGGPPLHLDSLKI